MDDTVLIQTKEDKYFIQDTLQKTLGFRVKASLIFRASRDGWSPIDFHNFCDSEGPTIVLFKSSTGKVSGGFTEISWGSVGGYVQKEDPNAFVFSMHDQHFYPI